MGKNKCMSGGVVMICHHQMVRVWKCVLKELLHTLKNIYEVSKGVKENAFDSSKIPDQCSPIHLNPVARHGTRTPTKKRMRDLEILSGQLKSLLQNAKEKGSSLEKVPSWLWGWTSPWKGKNKGGELLIHREDEMYHLEIRIRERFQELFIDDYHPDVYQIRATQEEKLEPIKFKTDDSRIQLLNRLYARKIKQLKAREQSKNVEVEEVRVKDRSVDDLVSFINSGDEGIKPAKNKKRNRRKKHLHKDLSPNIENKNHYKETDSLSSSYNSETEDMPNQSISLKLLGYASPESNFDDELDPALKAQFHSFVYYKWVKIKQTRLM